MAAGYLDLPGSSDYLTTADKAGLDVTGDIEIACAVRADDYSPASENGHILNKFTASSSTQGRSYVFSHTTDGDLRFNWSTDGDGAGSDSGDSTVTIASVGISDGTDAWLKVTLDVDNGSSGYDLKFWYSQDSVDTAVGSVSWTQLGSTVVGGSTTSIFASTTDLFIGKFADNLGADFAGRIYGIWLYDGIGGTLKADPDFRDNDQGWSTFPGVDDQSNSWADTGDITWVAPTASGTASGTGSGTGAATGVPTHKGTASGTGSGAGSATSHPILRAELLLQAKNYSGSGNWLDEANSHDAVNNGALFLAHTGTQYLHLPGINGNYMTAPDIAAYDVSDTFFLAAFVALDDWTPGSIMAIVGQWTAAGNQRSYLLRIGSSGNLQMSASDNGTTNETITGSVPGFTNGVAQWIGCSFNGGTVQFFTGGTDPSSPSWSQIGSDVSFGSVTSCHNSTGVLGVGAINDGAAQFLAGKVYRVIVYSDTTPSTIVFDANLTNTTAVTEPFATFTEASSNAATVTIKRASSGVKATVVDHPLWLFGTNDQIDIPDAATLDSATGEDVSVLVGVRLYGTAASFGRVFAKSDDVNFYEAFWDTGVDPPRLQARIDDNTTVEDSVHEPAVAYGVSMVVAMVRDAGVTLTTYIDGVINTSGATVDATEDLSNANTFSIGASPWGGNVFDGEIYAVAMWREALSAADVAAAGTKLVTPTHKATATGTGVGTGAAAGVPTHKGTAAGGSVDQFLDGPGTADDYADTPDHADLSFTGDFELIGDMALVDWASGDSQIIVGKWGDTSAWAYIFQVNADGSLFANFSDDGVTVTGQQSSSVGTGFSGGTRNQVRVTVDVDNGSSNSAFNFYTRATSADSWVLLGTADQLADPGSVFDSNGGVEVGRYTFLGPLYNVQIVDGIGGTLVGDFNAEDFTLGDSDTDTAVDSTGKTWTIRGASSVIDEESGTGVGAATGALPTANGTAAGTGVGTGAATGLPTHKGTAAGTGSGTGAATGLPTHKGTAIGTGVGAGAARGTHLGTAAGTGSGTGAATGVAGITGTASGTGLGVGAATGLPTHKGTGVGTGSGVGAATGLPTHKGTGTGAGVGTGTAAGFTIPVITGTAAGFGSGRGAAFSKVPDKPPMSFRSITHFRTASQLRVRRPRVR